MANFNKVSVSEEARTELHDKLSLTGAEISINHLSAGGSVAIVDGETVELAAGDWIRISPEAKRQFFASEDTAISFICIQVKEHSLEGYTMEDGVSE